MTYINQQDINLKNAKTIDLETGNHLIWEGGGGGRDREDRCDKFTFYYQGNAVSFDAREERLYDYNSNLIGIHWEILLVDTHYGISGQKRKKIIAQIEEALRVFGYAYDNKDYRITSACYTPKPWVPSDNRP